MRRTPEAPGIAEIETIPDFAIRARDPRDMPYDPEVAFQCMMFLEGIRWKESLEVDIPDSESRRFSRLVSQCYKSVACGISMIGTSGLQVRIPKGSAIVIGRVLRIASSLRVANYFPPVSIERFRCDDRVSDYLTLNVPLIRNAEAVRGFHKRDVSVASMMLYDKAFCDIRRLILDENRELIDAIFDLCDLVAKTCGALGISVEPFETTDLEYCAHPMIVFSWSIQAWHDYVYPLSVKIVNRHMELNVA